MRRVAMLTMLVLGAPFAGALPSARGATPPAAVAPHDASSPAASGTATSGGYLDPSAAFRLTATRRTPDAITLHWDIAHGYHLYRDRLEVNVLNGGWHVGDVQRPAGVRSYDSNLQQEVETWHDAVDVIVPVDPGADGTRVGRLEIVSQGCADKGLCYPPDTHIVRLEGSGGALGTVALEASPEDAWGQPTADPGDATGGTPSSTTVVSTTTAPDATVTASIADSPAVTAATEAASDLAGSDQPMGRALASGSLLTVCGVFLLAGLLLSLTPCVLPMVPILSSIIVGHGEKLSRMRGFGLSLAYALGMAIVYTALGVAAGLLGEGLASMLQNPWVLGTFALLLATLSLSMFGLYELQVPSALQNRLNTMSNRLPAGQGLGAFVMGGLSALICGPCVAPPLAGALIYIGQTHDVLLGGLALFSLAMGMSVPLLLVGVSAGSLLPRAGAWMEGVKRFFGVLLLAVALWMVTPVLPAWVTMIAWALLALGVAAALHAFDRLPEGSPVSARLTKGFGVALTLFAAAQLLGVLSGGRDTLQPLAHLMTLPTTAANAAMGPGGETAPAFRRVTTVADLERAIADSPRPVLLDFYADWCTSCKEMERFTFSDPGVARRMADLTLLRVDVTGNTASDRQLLKRYGLFGPPAILFFGGDGRELAARRVIGYLDAEAFGSHLPAGGS